MKWSRGQQQTASTFPQGLRAWEVRWQKAGFPSLPTPFCQRQPQSPTSLSWSPITHRKWKLSASRAVPNRSPRAVRYGMEKLSGSLPLRHMECTIQSDIHNNSNTWRRKKRLDHHILIIKDTARSLHNSYRGRHTPLRRNCLNSQDHHGIIKQRNNLLFWEIDFTFLKVTFSLV